MLTNYSIPYDINFYLYLRDTEFMMAEQQHYSMMYKVVQKSKEPAEWELCTSSDFQYIAGNQTKLTVVDDQLIITFIGQQTSLMLGIKSCGKLTTLNSNQLNIIVKHKLYFLSKIQLFHVKLRDLISIINDTAKKNVRVELPNYPRINTQKLREAFVNRQLTMRMYAYNYSSKELIIWDQYGHITPCVVYVSHKKFITPSSFITLNQHITRSLCVFRMFVHKSLLSNKVTIKHISILRELLNQDEYIFGELDKSVVFDDLIRTSVIQSKTIFELLLNIYTYIQSHLSFDQFVQMVYYYQYFDEPLDLNKNAYPSTLPPIDMDQVNSDILDYLVLMDHGNDGNDDDKTVLGSLVKEDETEFNSDEINDVSHILIRNLPNVDKELKCEGCKERLFVTDLATSFMTNDMARVGYMCSFDCFYNMDSDKTVS